MQDDNPLSSGGHLEYYEQYDISPVRYSIGDLDIHFDRRDSLYRSLGLPPAAFRNARVLEVAPGSGQNSLYIAAQHPADYDLVEPNPAGARDIAGTYAGLALPHTRPNLHRVKFEDFDADGTYDIVICENWLGMLPHELRLIARLGSLVSPGGVLVLTAVPLSGFFPNIMRKLLALRLIDRSQDFETQTANMVDVFAPHLATMGAMTRSAADWVQDCMLNPHYLNVALPIDVALDAAGGEMEALATFPRFSQDWRWFKSLTGAARGFNAQILDALRRNVHNFVDYRMAGPARDPERNAPLDACFSGLHEAALRWQAAFEDDRLPDLGEAHREIAGLLARIGSELGGIDRALGDAVEELRAVWVMDRLSAGDVRAMKPFAGLFGRETVYLSLTRRRAG